MHRNIHVEESSGNVFADIGLPKPEERLAKADLAIRIAETIRARDRASLPSHRQPKPARTGRNREDAIRSPAVPTAAISSTPRFRASSTIAVTRW